MMYSVLHKDGALHMVNATTAQEAHMMAGDGVRVYPATTTTDGTISIDGVHAGALQVVRRTTANMIRREGGTLQWQLYYDCRRTDGQYSHNVQDCISVATLAIMEAIAQGIDIAGQYHAAYLALNRHLRSTRQINLSATAQRTIYIEDIHGDIINVYANIGRILAPGDRYTPPADDVAINDDRRIMLDIIVAALTPTQRKIIYHLARGYSHHQIAAAMHRNRATIIEHVRNIQRKAAALFPDFGKE